MMMWRGSTPAASRLLRLPVALVQSHRWAGTSPTAKPAPLQDQVVKARKAITLLVQRTEELSKKVESIESSKDAAEVAVRTTAATRTDVDSILGDVARIQGQLALLVDRVAALEASRKSAPAATPGEDGLTSSDAGTDDAPAASPVAADGALLRRIEALEVALAAGGVGGERVLGRSVRNAEELRRADAIADVDVDGASVVSTARVVVGGFPRGTRALALRTKLEAAGPIASILIRRGVPPRDGKAEVDETALVTYTDASAAARAVENLSGVMIGGDRITVTPVALGDADPTAEYSEGDASSNSQQDASTGAS